jgi:hypothetical protein
MADAVTAMTMPAWVRSSQLNSANGVLSRPRASNRIPNMINSVAVSLGRKPAPGMDKRPIGRSPLNAKTSTPNPTKTMPAT